MEKALENTKIAEKYQLSLKTFFKDDFKYSNDSYLIPFSHVKYTKRQIFDYIRSSCSGDYNITKEKRYVDYFVFNNFKLTSDSQMTLIPIKVKSWNMIPVQKHLLHKLTYSARLSFLK